MTSIKDKCKIAIENNELKLFLEGKGKYNIQDQEGLSNDYSAALVEGIYALYDEQESIKSIYETTLIDMMNSVVKELLYAYNYINLQIKMEKRGIAPFTLPVELYKDLKQKISEKKEELANFRDIPEFGSSLQNGAYEFIENMENITEEYYGRRTI